MLRAMFLPLLLLCFSAFRQTAAVSMRCPGSELLEDNDYSFYCYYGHRGNTVTWTQVSATGQTTDIGSCHGIDACTPHLSPNYELRWHSWRSDLTIRDIGRSVASIVCSEHQSDGSFETANCTFSVLSVWMLSCGSRGYEVTENYDRSVTCYVSDTTQPITWSLVTPSGQIKTLGSCRSVNTCSSPYSPYINVTRTSSGYSHLRIDNIKRETAGVLICSDGTDTYNCTLDVQIPVTVDACTVQVHRDNWTVSVSCDISRAYSALGRFEYRVYQIWKPSAQWSSAFGSYVFDDLQPYTPTAYINHTTGKGLYKGTYTSSWPLPHRDGIYSDFRTTTYPGGINAQVNGSFVVERPSPPSVQCEGALRDAGRVPCVCSTSSLGSPAGRLIWFSGDTVFAAGQYGVTSLQFPSDVTDDGCDVMQITCQLDWTLKQNLSFALTCVARNTADTDEQNSPDTSSAERVWGITVSALLGVVVVVVVVLVIVLLRRGQCSRGGGDPDAGTVHFSQHQPQAEDPVHTYTGLNIQHAAGRGKKNKGSAKTRTTSLGDPEHVYENTDVTDNP